MLEPAQCSCDAGSEHQNLRPIQGCRGMIRVDQRTVECGGGGGGNEPIYQPCMRRFQTQDPSHLLGGDGFTTSNCGTFKLRGFDTLHPSDAQQWDSLQDSLDKSTGLRTRVA